MKKDGQITFQPSGKRGMIPLGKTLLEASRFLSVGIESPCGGNQRCGKCRVRISPGSADTLSPITEAERDRLTSKERAEGIRLACAAVIEGDLTVFIPEESCPGSQVVRKGTQSRDVALNPGVRLFPVTLSAPDLQNPRSDEERLLDALADRYHLIKPAIDVAALQALPGCLRKGQVTAALWMEREIIALFPGKTEECFGLAIDIGSTTIAVYLCSLTTGKVTAAVSAMNPQVAYGEDVMSRIGHVIDRGKEELTRLRETLVAELNRMIASAADQGGITLEEILDLTVVGNTAMHHIFLGINPRSLGCSPFTPTIRRGFDLKARDLGLAVHPGANCHCLPIEAGFVGADNVAVLIAEAPYRQKEQVLIIDVGTNGELVLGNSDRLLSCSCASGPALEGAHIRFGMRASPGAIERIRVDTRTKDVSFKVVGEEGWGPEKKITSARGICGSGIIEGVAELYRAGVIDGSGRFRQNLETPRLRLKDGKTSFVIAWREETTLEEEITIGQQDIRNVQLAKAALYAGAKLMMKRLSLERVDRVLLAGAFGSVIDPLAAMTLGMFPDCDPDRISSVGNAAGEGARIALLDKEKRREAEKIARQTEYLELTVAQDFQEEFLAALSFPHERDPFPHLLANTKDYE